MKDQETLDVNIQEVGALISPSKLGNQIPNSSNATKAVLKGRVDIQNILTSEDDRLLVIAGPCSVHNTDEALDYSKKLIELSEKVKDKILVVMRVYFEKPRTTVGWKGMLYDPNLNDTFDINLGLKKARELLLKINESGMPTATEFLDPIVPQYIADLVSWAAIGARTTESQTHRQMASGLSMPVGFKNGTDGRAQTAVDALIAARAPQSFLGIDHEGKSSVIHTKGNPYGHLVLRGGNQGPNFRAESVSEAQSLCSAGDVRPQLMVDCSHGNSNKDHRLQAPAFKDVVQQRVDGNNNIIGIMIESNMNPGAQKLNGNASSLEYGVSVTDACIGWDETEEILNWAYDILQ